MAEILSQAEIEALLSSMASDVNTGTSAPANRSESAWSQTPSVAVEHSTQSLVAYEPYNFRRSDKFAKDQLRTLQMMHETFARLLATSLSAYLRTAVHVELVSVEQVLYEEYIRSLSTSLINVFSMPPLTGQAILEMDMAIVFSMIDRLLGGPGNTAKNVTALTEIEQALANSIVTRALKEFKAAWEGIAHINPRREFIETQAQFVQIVPSNDIVVSILFEIQVSDLRGAMSVCVPYLVFKPIIAKFSAQRWFAEGGSKRSSQSTLSLAKNIGMTRVACQVVLGHSKITVSQLLDLKPGDHIILDRKADDEVDVVVGNSVKFKGRAGTRGKKIAIHINRPAVSADTAADLVAA